MFQAILACVDLLPFRLRPYFMLAPAPPHMCKSKKSLTKGFNEVEMVVAKTMQCLSVPAVVGHEGVLLRHLERDFQNIIGLSSIRHEGLLEIHGNDPHAGIICAHIDRHGLISIGGGEYAYAAQYMREIKYGEQNRSSITQLRDIAERFEDEIVYAYDPETGKKLGRGMIKPSEVGMVNGDSIFTILGMPHMPLNCPVAYARTTRSEKGELKGQIDNAVSLGVVYMLFNKGFQGTALLTTEEEIGKSWIHIGNWLEKNAIETKNLIVLDTSPYQTEDPIERGTLVFRNRDKSEIFDTDFVARLKERCEDLELPYEMKDEILLKRGKRTEELGSTELGRLIQGHSGRWSGATVQIPTNMYHTSNETTTRAALKTYVRFLKNILIEDPLVMNIIVKNDI